MYSKIIIVRTQETSFTTISDVDEDVSLDYSHTTSSAFSM